MAAYAPVCGAKMLRWLIEEEMKGRYKTLISHTLMLLAHEVLKHPLEYFDLARDAHDKAGVRTIIMDNSLVEIMDGTSEPLDFTDVFKAALHVGADYVILPDVMGKAHESIQASRNALTHIEASGRLDTHPRTAFVLQGHNTMILAAAAAGFAIEHEAKMLCVPRVIANTMGTRRSVLESIGARAKNSYKIHLLGMSNKVGDDFECCRFYPGVDSIDSANPIVSALVGEHGIWNHVKRPEGYFDIDPMELDDEMRHKILGNIQMTQARVMYHDDAERI